MQTSPGLVLAVDDNELNRDLLVRQLNREGHTVVTAADGLEALAVIRTQPFDLVLLDIMMPRLNGIEVLARLKADPDLRHVPVLMISALSEIQQVVRCIELGAEDYLVKPFNTILLYARITAALEKKRWHDQEQSYLHIIQAEQTRAEALLLNILPQAIAIRLKAGEDTIADSLPDVSILFADIVSFTQWANELSSQELIVLLNAIFSVFDQLTIEHGLEKIKTIGDAYMVVGGLAGSSPDHLMALADLGLSMQQAITQFTNPAGSPFSLRIGIHVGTAIAGVIGTTKFSYDLWGVDVNIASRMHTQGLPGRIQVTEAVYSRLQQHYHFEERGRIVVKGMGEMKSYFLIGRK